MRGQHVGGRNCGFVPLPETDFETGANPPQRGADSGGEVMQEQERDAVWFWSEAFGKAVERAMLEPPTDPAERSDWPKFCDRLTQWWRDVEEARKDYLAQRPAQLRNLYNFWRNVGRENPREQAMLARHSYPRFRMWGWRARAALCNHGEN
jgi:hypothetical protein